MKFRIRGVAKDGAEKSGTINADSEDQAIRKAKKSGIFVSHIEPVVKVAQDDPAPVDEQGAPASPPQPQVRPSSGEVIISSGSICAEYNVLGLVVGFASKTEGCTGTIQVEGVYQAALQRLIEGAQARSANGLIHVNFQNRVASQTGCGSARQVFEVFAWGTAIQF